MTDIPVAILKGKQSTDKHFFLVIGLFLLIAYFPLFLHLDADPIHAWDESMFAMRAYHLANEGTYLENFNAYSAGFDNPNIKPPLGTYFQVAAFYLVGYNELAIRLPVALFCLAAGLAVIVFFKRYFGNYWPGLFAALVLVCSPGFIHQHIARTGDHEGILLFLVLAALLGFYQFIATGKAKWIYISAIFFALGFLTKSLVAFFALPGMLLYLIFKNQLRLVINSKHVWLALSLFVIIIVLQYTIIGLISPNNFKYLGLKTVQERYTSTIHGHAAPVWFYWQGLAFWRFFPWIFLLPLGLFFAFLKPFKPYRDLIMLLLLATISHLLVLSFSKTKLEWYDAAVLPWLAIIAGFAIWVIVNTLTYRLTLAPRARIALFVLLIATIFGLPYTKEVTQNMGRTISTPEQQIGNLLKKVRDDNKHLRTFTLLDNRHVGNLVASFYVNSMNQHQGFDIHWQNNYQNVSVGDTIGYCHAGVNQWVDSFYVSRDLLSTEGCKIVVLMDTLINTAPSPTPISASLDASAVTF